MGLLTMRLTTVVICFIFQAVASSGKWWEHTNLYQIYPRSFQDSNDDGTGDLACITARLDSLVDIGVEAFWLPPIYASPMADFGYDVSNYTDVDPIFGTLEDFDNLSKEAQKRNLKIIMDFIPNHSSDQHEWFIKSENREEPYTDYYIWRDRNESNPGGVPNNWLSVFRFSAWTWSEKRQQFYYHAFLPEQPDLNYWNPAIIQEMKDVLKFWTDRGVAGFRMDAVPFLFEDQQFRDEPVSGKTNDTNDYGYLDHIYTWNFPEVIDVLAQFTESVRDNTKGDGFVMVEALSEDLTTEDMMTFYDCSDFAFNFNLILKIEPFYSFKFSGDAIKNAVADWLDNMPEGKTANWVLGNHDNWRVRTRFGEPNIVGFNMIALLLPGVSVTYQGEEIGMTNTNVSWEDTVDPAGLNCGEEHFQDMGCSRDPERTPMQWNSSANAGFSNGKPWLPVNENYKTVNVETQIAIEDSHLNIYKQLTSLRRNESVFATGSTSLFSSSGVFAFARFDSDVTYVTAANVMKENVDVDLLTLAFDTTGEIVVRSSGVVNNATVVGNTVDMAKITLSGFEAIVVKLGGAATTSGSTQKLINPVVFIFLHLVVFFLASQG